MNMENRRLLHSLTLMHKISLGHALEYLNDQIVRHSDLHEYNTRGRDNIAVPRVNTNTRSNSFFISIPKLYNEILPTFNENPDLKISVETFKKKCKLYLSNLQFPHLS